MANWSIEPLGGEHVRTDFDCGQPKLNEFLRTLAGQYERKGVGRTYVLVPNDEKVVAGYYTLASSQLDLGRLSAKLAKKLPKHPVPVILLGRLAIDRRHQGKGLGPDLLIDASKRCLKVAQEIGVFALATVAIDEQAMRFYSRFGFESSEDQPLTMFISTESLRKLLEPNNP